MGYTTVDIRQLNYFISVANNLNFTKAAEQHFISQTAMSQQILALEEGLGVKLFIRNNRNVRLTPAGKVFYKEAKLIVARYNEAVKRTLSTASGFEGNLRVGFIGVHEKGFLPKLIRSFHHKYPAIELTIIQNNNEKLYKDLEQGLIDMTFNLKFNMENYPNVDWKSIRKDPICAIVYRDHPLAKNHTISRSALRYEPFVVLKREESPYGYDNMVEDCLSSGFSPNIVHRAGSIETMLLMVEAEMGIAMFPKTAEVYGNENLRYINLEENKTIELIIAWIKENDNPSIPLFLDILEDIIR